MKIWYNLQTVVTIAQAEIDTLYNVKNLQEYSFKTYNIKHL